MDRLIAPGTVDAAHADVAPATGTPGFATDGNPATNTPATQWPAYAFNSIQEELAAVIEAAGLALDRNNNAQLLAALHATSATVSGLIKITTTALAQGLTDDTTALTPKKLSDAFKGSNQLLAANGYQKLPGGLVIQWGTSAPINSGSSLLVTFPIAFPNRALVATVGHWAGSIVLSHQTFSTNVGNGTAVTQMTVYAFGANQPTQWIALGF